MSTPSPQPLDYDLVSPYAPKHARDSQSPSPASEKSAPPPKPRPAAIESDNDAKLFDEIEASLRAIVKAEHPAPKAEAPSEEQAPREDAEASAKEENNPPGEPMQRTIDALEAPALAEDRRSQEQRYREAMRVQEVLQRVSQHLTHRSPHEAPAAAPTPEPVPVPEQPMEEYRLPPAFLARPMDPIRFDEPNDKPFDASWPKPRPKPRRSAIGLFVRFGFAAGAAAAVMLFALPDLRARFFDTVSTQFASLSSNLTALSSNAESVFGEGRPAPAKVDSPRSEPFAPIAVRTEPIVLAKEPDRPDAAPPKLAAANPAPVQPEQRSAPSSENAPRQRETVMVPQRAMPEAPSRSQDVRQGPPGRAENESPTTGLATRPLAAEEIELLRKMAGEFIAAGDYAGARGVLERAAEAGDATSALQLATTYDPAALARFKVKGLVPDNAKAAFWYERARDLGSVEAPFRLKALVARSN